MTPESAQQINAEMVKTHLHGMGIGKAPNFTFLRSQRLADLIAARDLVAASNAAATAAGPPYTLTTVCDDRLVAAIYTALHYDPSEADEPDPILVQTDGDRTTALVHVIAPMTPDQAADET